MLFKLSNLNSNLALTLGYLNLALNNSALEYSWQVFFFFFNMPVTDIRVYLHEGFSPVSSNQPWWCSNCPSWNLLLCCLRQRTEPLPMIHEQRTSSRFGEISEPHCHQKSWNIHCHCGDNDRICIRRLRECFIFFFLLLLFSKYESIPFNDRSSKELIYDHLYHVLMHFLLLALIHHI